MERSISAPAASDLERSISAPDMERSNSAPGQSVKSQVSVKSVEEDYLMEEKYLENEHCALAVVPANNSCSEVGGRGLPGGREVPGERGPRQQLGQQPGYVLTTSERRSLFLEAVAKFTFPLAAQYRQQNRGPKLNKARADFEQQLPSSHMGASQARRRESLESLITKQKIKELPCVLSAAMFNSYVACMVQEDWAPLSTAFITHTRDITQQYIMQAFTEALSGYPLASAYVSDCIAQVCEECLATALEHASSVLIRERAPLTQDTDVFSYIQAKRDESLKQGILVQFPYLLGKHGVRAHADKHHAVAGTIRRIPSARDIIEAAVANAKVSKVHTQHSAEEMQSVLDAHGDAAAKRIALRVCMIADQMADNVVVKIHKVLMEVTDATLQSIMRGEGEGEGEQPPHVLNL
jgi:hypothetical protein